MGSRSGHPDHFRRGMRGLDLQKTSLNLEWQEQWKVRGWEDLLYQDLLRKVRFNRSAANRLIEYEKKQDPQASRLKLIQNAIERWDAITARPAEKWGLKTARIMAVKLMDGFFIYR